MSTLPGIGEIRYNGFVFDGPMVSSSVSIQNVRSDDDRTVVGQTLTIELHCIIDTEHCNELQSDIEAQLLVPLDQITSMLSQDGKELIFDDKVFHRFHINSEPTDQYRMVDINFGPRVKQCTIKPLASNRAFEVIWSVETTVGYCPIFDEDGIPSGEHLQSWTDGDVKQIVYNVIFSSDNKGYQTRKTTGFLEIITNPLMNGIQRTADEYRERLVFPLGLGMTRTQDFSLNERRDRLTFTIVDDEFRSQNAFPIGVVDISVRQSTTIGEQSGYCQATTTLSGHCEVANGLTTTHAWARAYSILATRITAARSEAPILLKDIRVEEEIFGRTVQFSITYQKLGTSPVGFLRSSGMFTQVDTSWEDWRDFMVELSGPLSSRGLSRQEYDKNRDLIIGPCSPQPAGVTVTFPDAATPLAVPPSLLVFSNIKPSAALSYNYYRSKLVSEVQPAASGFAEMPIFGVTYTPLEAKTSEGTVIAPALNSSSFQGRASDPHTVSPMVQLTLVGAASRLGYGVEIPSLSSQWSHLVSKVPSGSKIVNETREVFGQPLFISAWAIRYMVAESLVNAAADLGALTQQLFIIPSNPTGSQGKIE